MRRPNDLSTQRWIPESPVMIAKYLGVRHILVGISDQSSYPGRRIYNTANAERKPSTPTKTPNIISTRPKPGIKVPVQVNGQLIVKRQAEKEKE